MLDIQILEAFYGQLSKDKDTTVTLDKIILQQILIELISRKKRESKPDEAMSIVFNEAMSYCTTRLIDLLQDCAALDQITTQEVCEMISQEFSKSFPKKSLS